MPTPTASPTNANGKASNASNIGAIRRKFDKAAHVVVKTIVDKIEEKTAKPPPPRPMTLAREVRGMDGEE